MLGLSATPYRRDGLSCLIQYYIGETVHRVNPDHLEQIGAVLKPEIKWRDTYFRFPYNDNYHEMISALTSDEGRNQLIAGDVVKAAKGHGTGLVVSDRVEHLETMMDLVERYDVKCRLLTGRTGKIERKQIVEELNNNEIQVLFSTISLIGEGFDCAGLHTLFLTTPIRFSGRLKQVIGRILRPESGKRSVIYDYVDPVGVLKSSAKARSCTYRGDMD